MYICICIHIFIYIYTYVYRYNDEALPVPQLLLSHLPKNVPKCAHHFDVRSLAVLQVSPASLGFPLSFFCVYVVVRHKALLQTNLD